MYSCFVARFTHFFVEYEDFIFVKEWQTTQLSTKLCHYPKVELHISTTHHDNQYTSAVMCVVYDIVGYPAVFLDHWRCSKDPASTNWRISTATIWTGCWFRDRIESTRSNWSVRICNIQALLCPFYYMCIIPGLLFS